MLRPLVLATLLLLSLPVSASAEVWLKLDTYDAVANTASGTLNGKSVSISGTDLQAAPEATTSTFTGFSDPAVFTPALPTADVFYPAASHAGLAGYSIQFGAPVKDPVLHFASLRSILTFPAGTQIAKVSGQDELTVSGNVVSGGYRPDPEPNNDANGTVRLVGSFTSITFTAELPLGLASPDGFAMQIGEPLPPPETAIVIVGDSAAPKVTARATGVLAGAPYETRCVLDPPRPPATFAELPASCPFYDGLVVTAVGDHMLYAASRNATGEVEPSVVSRAFRVTAPPPVVTPTPPPPGPTSGGAGGVAPAPPSILRIDGPTSSVQKFSNVQLSAVVSGEFTSVAWDFDSDGVADYVGGRSVIFQPSRTTTVSATAVGPAGASAPARFTVQVRVLRSLKRVDDRVTGLAVYATLAEALASRNGRCLVSQIRAGTLHVKGCLQPVSSLKDVPASERPVLQEVARRAKIQPTEANLDNLLGRAAVYRAPGTVSVNGLEVTPRAGADTLFLPQLGALGSSGAQLSLGGKIPLESPGRFILDTTAARDGIVDLGRLKRLPGSLDDLAGFKLTGAEVDVKLVPGTPVMPPTARIVATLRLPAFFRTLGSDSEAQVTFTASANDGIVLDKAHFKLEDVDVGALKVQDLELSYDNTEWRGQGKACVAAEGVCLSMLPPQGGVVVRRDQLVFAGAKVTLDPPQFLFPPTVKLKEIDFALGLDPTRMLAGAKLVVSGIYDIDGRVVLAFPSASVPFLFDRGEVGGNFPASFYNRPYTSPTIAASVGGSVDVPVLGRIPLGAGYFLYEYPGYVAFGGNTVARLDGLFEVGGRLDGELNAGNGKFNLAGGVEGCIIALEDTFIGKLCRGFEGSISSRGAAACAELLWADVGLAVGWDPFHPILYLAGCRFDRFREPDVRGQSAQAGVRTIRVERGDPNRSITLEGAVDAPRVRVTGPDGETVDGSGPLTTGAHIGIMRVPRFRTTVVGLKNPLPGDYRIVELDGSAPITRVLEADALPPLKIPARVRADGGDRVLTYDVPARAGQEITFLDVSPSGATRTIGTTTRGGRGRLRFTPNPGRGRGRVEAQAALDGIPGERIVVARYALPSPTLATPRRLRATRRGSRLRLSWAAVAQAGAYELSVNAGRVRRTTRTRMTVTLPGSIAARVRVRAVDGLRAGRPATRSVRATAPPVNRLRRLSR